MEIAQREQIQKELFAECIGVATAKGKDYSGETDSLSNFKRNAEKLGLTKYQVWAVYCGKHLDSIFNSIKSSPENPQVESEPLRERIKDAINYLTILEALRLEDLENVKVT